MSNDKFKNTDFDKLFEGVDLENKLKECREGNESPKKDDKEAIKEEIAQIKRELEELSEESRKKGSQVEGLHREAAGMVSEYYSQQPRTVEHPPAPEKKQSILGAINNAIYEYARDDFYFKQLFKD